MVPTVDTISHCYIIE